MEAAAAAAAAVARGGGTGTDVDDETETAVADSETPTSTFPSSAAEGAGGGGETAEGPSSISLVAAEAEAEAAVEAGAEAEAAGPVGDEETGAGVAGGVGLTAVMPPASVSMKNLDRTMSRTAWRAILLSRWSWGASSLRRRVGLEAAAAAAALCLIFISSTVSGTWCVSGGQSLRTRAKWWLLPQRDTVKRGQTREDSQKALGLLINCLRIKKQKVPAPLSRTLTLHILNPASDERRPLSVRWSPTNTSLQRVPRHRGMM